MKTFLSITAVATMLATAQTAGAVCSQRELAGTWASYAVGANVRGDYWLQCTLRIDDRGKFTAASSNCVASSGLQSPAEGSLTVANLKFCSFKGMIELTKGTAANVINHATLAPDKNMAGGIGTFEGSGFSFNLVRVK